MKNLYNQKPVRRGAIYCSPWCGFNCTHAAYEKAHKKGKELAARLGKGWTYEVWENGDWHYKAKFGKYIRVHDHKGSYSVMIGTNGGGSYDFYICESTKSYKGIKQLIKNQLKNGHGALNKLQEMINEGERAAK